MQPTITLDYDGFPVDHPAATVAFVTQALAEVGPGLEEEFGVGFRLSDVEQRLVVLNKTDLNRRRLRLQAGLRLLFRSRALRGFLETPDEYAAVIWRFCGIPHGPRFQPMGHLFALVPNAEPTSVYCKFDLSHDEISAITAETDGELVMHYPYSVENLPRETVVSAVLPEVVFRIVRTPRADKRFVFPENQTTELVFDEVLDASKCQLLLD